MTTATASSPTAPAESPDKGVVCDALVLPSAEEIALTRAALKGRKLRAGAKMTIDTKKMKTRIWPIIEVWMAEKRRYLPLSVGEVWRYENNAARDKVLSALQNTKVTQMHSEDGAANPPIA